MFGDRKTAPNGNAAAAPKDENIHSWTKFCGVFCRDGTFPNFLHMALRQSMLKLPAECDSHAVKIFKALYRLTMEDLPADKTLLIFHYVMDRVERGEKALQAAAPSSQLKFCDELFCQILKLTYQNSDPAWTLRAWRVLATMLGVYSPTMPVVRVLFLYATDCAPNRQIAHICEQRLTRTVSLGSRRKKITSLEVTSLYCLKPMILTAVWPNGAGPLHFEVDPVATPAELMRSLAATIGLQSYFGYSVSVELNGMEWKVAPSEYIMDAVAQAESVLQPPIQFGDEIDKAMPAKTAIAPPPRKFEIVKVLYSTI